MVENGQEAEESVKKEVNYGGRGAWWKHVLLSAMLIGSSLLFLFLFSDLPYCYGDRIYLKLEDHYQYCLYALGGAVVLSIFLYISDVRFWNDGFWRWVGVFLVFLAVLGYSVAALLATKAFVVAPIGWFLFGTPICFLLLKAYMFRSMDLVSFLRTMIMSLWFISAGTLTMWLCWILIDDKWWTVENKQEYYIKMNCELEDDTVQLSDGSMIKVDQVDFTSPNITASDREIIDDTLSGCTSAFILWLLPFILFVWSFVFACVLYFINRTLIQARNAKDKTKAMDPLAQAFVMFIGLGLFGLWAAAGIAASEMSLTNVILGLSFLAMMICAVVVVAVFGWGDIKTGMGNTPLGSRMIRSMKSDWVKAMMLMLASPFFVFYLMLSVITQFSRRTFSCTKDLKEEDKHLIFTSRATRILKQVRQWNWTSVLVKSLWIGILFFTFVVGVARLTTLFLSWLNEQLLPISLAATTFIFMAVGITMFLLPPVPGVPVYISGGIILVNSAQHSLGGFWPACAYTMAICFMLKLGAIIIQQKVIGEMFASKKVWIRRFVGINSIEIRAIKHILLQPGMNIRKVSVLCGGPDWPVSVLTGILRLNVFSMLYGSLPVFFLIAPCVMAGALLLRASEGGAWASLSTLSLAVAFVTQSGAMLYAIHIIAKTIVEKEDQLKEWEDDQEVLALERASEAKLNLKRQVSHWKNLDIVNKIFLCIASICMTMSCYLFQLFGSYCFVKFEVDDSIAVELDGNAFNLVKDLGWIGLILFAYPCIYLAIYSTYINMKTSEVMQSPEKLEKVAQKLNEAPINFQVAPVTTASDAEMQMTSFGGSHAELVDRQSDDEDDDESDSQGSVADQEATIRKNTCWSILHRNFFVCCD